MITIEEAIEIVKKYLKERNRDYISINTENVQFEENERVIYGRYQDEVKNLYTVAYYIEGYQLPIAHYVTLDADSGEVLFTVSPHGYVEEWEDM